MADINNDHKTKKRNVCDSIIFEVELNDCSPEHSPKNDLNGKGSHKSGEFCFSQDSGVFSLDSGGFSQETNISCENEPGESGIIERDKRAGKDEKEDGEINENEDVTVVEAPTATAIVVEASTATTIVVDDKKQTNTTEPDIVTKATEEAITAAKHTNIKECVKITQPVTKETVVAHTDEQMDFNDVITPASCETVDGRISSNKVQDGEIPDERKNSIISISFKDTDVAREYKSVFLKFLRAHVELNVVEAGENGLKLEITRDPDLAANDWVVMDESFEGIARPDKFKPRKRKRSERKKEKDLFMLDTNPSITTKENVSLRYLSKFSVVDTEDGQKEIETSAKPVGTTCFNCDGNHSLRDCTEPKNFSKINMARNIFKNNQTKSA